MTGEKTSRKNVAVLISGRGSNMECLIRASRVETYPARIVGVIASTPAAAGLERAHREGVPTAINRLAEFTDRPAADAAMTRQLHAWKTDIVCLAGFMRILSADFVDHWHGRLINIHPSLLPRFKGLDTHRRALQAGDAEHGCTVHFVEPELDAGPPILQQSLPVLPHDTPQTLAARVLEIEHRIYPEALAMLARGEIALPPAPTKH